jgi:hypothetical protein
MHPEELDGMRRSLAIGGSLTRADTERLLDTAPACAPSRPPSPASSPSSGPRSRQARAALNELARIVVAAR